MRAFLVTSLCLGVVLSSFGASAQEAAKQPLQIGPSGQAYLASLGYRSVQTDVGYYDPTQGLPRLETEQEPAPKPAAGGDPGLDIDAPALSTMRIVAMLVAAGVLIALAMLILRNVGGFTLSLREDTQNPTRLRRSSGPAIRPAGPPADLAAILAQRDRRRALDLLAQAALARATAAQGVLLQPSWTMRDTLRHLPKGQPQTEPLRALVLFGERVLFGNRDVSEAEFQAHVAAMRPLLTSGTPA